MDILLNLAITVLSLIALVRGIIFAMRAISVEFEDRRENRPGPLFDKGDIVALKPYIKFTPEVYSTFGSITRKRLFSLIGKPLEIEKRIESQSGDVWYEVNLFNKYRLPESWLVCQFKKE